MTGTSPNPAPSSDPWLHAFRYALRLQAEGRRRRLEAQQAACQQKAAETAEGEAQPDTDGH